MMPCVSPLVANSTDAMMENSLGEISCNTTLVFLPVNDSSSLTITFLVSSCFQSSVLIVVSNVLPFSSDSLIENLQVSTMQTCDRHPTPRSLLKHRVASWLTGSSSLSGRNRVRMSNGTRCFAVFG